MAKQFERYVRFPGVVLLGALLFVGCGDDAPMATPDGGGMGDSGMGDTGSPDTGMADSGMPDTGPGDPMPRGAANPPTLGSQIDRQGRAAISTALMETFNGDSDAKGAAKDGYNANSAPATWADDYVDPFMASLAILDSLDTVCGNQLLADDANEAGRYATLATVLADDQLYVNAASGTCGVYLGVEAEAIGAVGEGEGGCGGRTPNDDVIDRSYSVLAAGILTGVDDTITEDDATHSVDTFPFLAAPN